MNIGDAKDHVVRRLMLITRSEWNKVYEDLQKAFSKAKPDDTSLACLSVFEHYSDLMNKIQRNSYVKLRQMAATPDINLMNFDRMRYDPIKYLPGDFDEVGERAEALHAAMRKGERLGYVVIGDDRLERCQLKRIGSIYPSTQYISHNGLPQPGIYTYGHNSDSRPYGTDGDTSGSGSGRGGDRGSSSSSYYIGH
ncbi:hypothetical protein SeLEV6574_g01819 [Synchytrium endobioticum]|uniref:Uncharacterized protein n=1 Tax=Synchytrium endobioticum TaxID=286115 RepID=A0A507DD89_9FUNG|nr:hypothetical protein SeLEV6574_g01819 [Synchytrium endobioticum]